MTILCAPDSFKGTLTAAAAAKAMASGVRHAGGEADVCPVADGGEGTVDALVAAVGGEIRHETVTGPRGERIDAAWGLDGHGGVGFVELAAASGLMILRQRHRDPTATTTFGTGELIVAATRAGCSSIIVGIGGSATCDGGAGIAQALGGRFFDRDGRLIEQPLTGGRLMEIARYEPPVDPPEIRVAYDVSNPLIGPSGAAAVYGPQKGATPEQVEQLERGLRHLAAVVEADPAVPGYGAAGGAGFGLAVLCNASLEPGIDLVLGAVGFESRCRNATLVLTGEGRLDGQSLHGKACMGVARDAARVGRRTIAIVGSTGDGVERCVDPAHGGMLARHVSLADRFGVRRAQQDTAELLRLVAAEVVRESAG